MRIQGATKRLLIVSAWLLFVGLVIHQSIKSDNERVYASVYDLASDIKSKNVYIGKRYSAISIQEVVYDKSADAFVLPRISSKACDALMELVEVDCTSGKLVLNNASEYDDFSFYMRMHEEDKKKEEYVKKQS